MQSDSELKLESRRLQKSQKPSSYLNLILGLGWFALVDTLILRLSGADSMRSRGFGWQRFSSIL